jgi:hypothetical protein
MTPAIGGGVMLFPAAATTKEIMMENGEPVTTKTVEVETNSPLVNHARRELAAVGEIYDGMVNEAAIDIVGLFAAQGHSGGSAVLTTEIVGRLMRFEPLSPLTGADDEWMEVGTGVWQNTRCSHVFKDSERAWDINLPRPDGEPFVGIAFPYTPSVA